MDSIINKINAVSVDGQGLFDRNILGISGMKKFDSLSFL